MRSPHWFLRMIGAVASDPMETYETSQPWVTYTYRYTDRALVVLRRSWITATCCICGKREDICVREGERVSQRHPRREAFLQEHTHPNERDNPYVWAQPLRNAAAWGNQGLDIGWLVQQRMAPPAPGEGGE